MKYLGAYLLAVMGGNEKPSAADVTKILESGGIEADSATLDRVLSAIGDKDINELIAEGMTKLASVPSGGGGGGGGGAGGGDAPAAEEVKEEEKEESDEEADDMDFDLFD